LLSNPADAERLTRVLFENSTTIGVRQRTETRRVLPRRAATVQTQWGRVQVKVVSLPDGRERATPEYDSCAALAKSAGVPLIEIYRAAAAITRFEAVPESSK
jgi:uncharacterized protein (DUF111 family)